MAAGLDTERLSLAFQSRPDLVERIRGAADSPARISLFNSISSFVCDQLNTGDEPALKRRRVDAANSSNGAANGHAHGAALPARQAAAAAGGGASAEGGLAAATAETVLLEVKDISLTIPQRKKFDLCFTKNYLYARASGTAGPVPGIVYAWTDIEHVFYLPVPEKAQLQYNYILFPRNVALAPLSKTPPADGAAPAAVAEPLLFTVPATAPKPGSVGGPSAGLASSVSDSYSTLLHWALEGQLRSVGNAYVKAIVATDPKLFHSAARQAFRPNEKAVHVRAFRGSKDGYLFFLPTGILWGFKKPLLFIPLDRIVAVSYTNVLQRTFNIAVEVDVSGTGGADAPDSGKTEEVEFGMIDQEDYGGIDETYVRRHGLQDRSMAERRKAKRELAENARGEGKRRGDGDDAAAEDGAADGDGAEDDGLTELQRAEQQLQDEEDDLEEDYDPGSDGDSGGSGASSDEEEEGEGEEEEYDEDEVEGEEGEEGEDGEEREEGEED